MPKSDSSNRHDTALYVLMSMLGAAQPFISTGQIPKWSGVPIAILLAGLTTWKAKRSPGKDEEATAGDNTDAKVEG